MPSPPPVGEAFVACYQDLDLSTNTYTLKNNAANLARIRDNQRRSRARRREYILELETKLRQCEVQGVEASAEVQLAARRVAEENRQLRGLLNQQGVDDRSIAHYLQNAAVASSEGSGSSTVSPLAGETSVQTLHQLMAPRKAASQQSTRSLPLINEDTGEPSSTSMSPVTSPGWQSQPPIDSIEPPPYDLPPPTQALYTMTMTSIPQHYSAPLTVQSDTSSRHDMQYNMTMASQHTGGVSPQNFQAQALSHDEAMPVLGYTMKAYPYTTEHEVDYLNQRGY